MERLAMFVALTLFIWFLWLLLAVDWEGAWSREQWRGTVGGLLATLAMSALIAVPAGACLRWWP